MHRSTRFFQKTIWVAIAEKHRDMTLQDQLDTDVKTLPGVREPEAPNLPVLMPPRKRPSRWLHRANFMLIPLAIAAGIWWWMHSGPALPPGFAMANGRLEADAVDIDTKFPGRILQLNVDEGDLVKPGQVVAVMDTRDLQARRRLTSSSRRS